MNHYTYMIKANDMFYIGVRSCDGLPEEDNYFSSCKTLLSWIKTNGVDKVVKSIIAVFPTRNLAIEHEIELHNFYDVAKNKLFWNKAKQTAVGFSPVPCTPFTETHKINMSKSRIGFKVSQETKDKISASRKGYSHSFETIEKIKSANTPDKHPKGMLGKTHSEETKQKMKMNNGSKSKQECQFCGREITLNVFHRWHGDNCKSKGDK